VKLKKRILTEKFEVKEMREDESFWNEKEVEVDDEADNRHSRRELLHLQTNE